MIGILYVIIAGIKLTAKIKAEILRPVWQHRRFYKSGLKKFLNPVIELVNTMEQAIAECGYFKYPVYDPSKRDPRDPQAMAGFYWIRR